MNQSVAERSSTFVLTYPWPSQTKHGSVPHPVPAGDGSFESQHMEAKLRTACCGLTTGFTDVLKLQGGKLGSCLPLGSSGWTPDRGSGHTAHVNFEVHWGHSADPGDLRLQAAAIRLRSIGDVT